MTKMTKEEMDQKLIEACILEKWLPAALTGETCGAGLDGYPIEAGRWWNCYTNDRGEELMDLYEQETCCLCQVYNPNKDDRANWLYFATGKDEPLEYCCWECPISRSTGRKFCVGTPYDAYHRGYQLKARNEVEFLLSLLPEDNVLRTRIRFEEVG